jgi:hypothetical protein
MKLTFLPKLRSLIILYYITRILGNNIGTHLLETTSLLLILRFY